MTETVVCVRCKRTMHPVGMVDDPDRTGRKRCGAYNARTCGQLEQARLDNAAATRLLREQARDACTRGDSNP